LCDRFYFTPELSFWLNNIKSFSGPTTGNRREKTMLNCWRYPLGVGWRSIPVLLRDAVLGTAYLEEAMQ
jgi:hypothetical protein